MSFQKARINLLYQGGQRRKRDATEALDFSPRPTPLERNYSSRLSFVSHNRKSSLVEPAAQCLSRTSSSGNTAPSTSSPVLVESPDLGEGSSNRSPLTHYGLTTIATRRGSSSSLKTSFDVNSDYFTQERSSLSHEPPRPVSFTSSNGPSPTKASSNVANMLQTKRKASGPFSAQQRPHSGLDIDTSPLSQNSANGLASYLWHHQAPHPGAESRPAPRRQRSRHNTRVLGSDQLSPISPLSPGSSIHTSQTTMPSPERPYLTSWQMLEPSDILMTPTTEEWRSYGGSIGSNRLKVRQASYKSLRLSGESPRSDDLAKVSTDLDGNLDPGSNSSTSGEDSDIDVDEPEELVDTRSDKALSKSPALSFKLSSFNLKAPSAPPSITLKAHETSQLNLNSMFSYLSPSKSTDGSSRGLVLIDLPPPPPETPVPLDPIGPVDPKKYSAKTGARQINSFFIQGSAGEGGYGTVVRARERSADGWSTGPEIIIKLIIKLRILADCWNKHRILGAIPVEIHVLDHLRRIPYSSVLPPLPVDVDPPPPTGHPNICVILDFFEDAEHWYLCMAEFGSGQDLFDYVDKAPEGLSLAEMQSLFTQVARAVAFLHAHGIVHRDIKDENIILDGEGRVQLVDFGSAAYIKEGRKFDTFSGTLDFAAPEVLRGERYDGRQTDIWALGVLGYVMLCGESPFWTREEATFGVGESTRARAALKAKLTKTDRPDLMADAVDLVSQCLETACFDRPTAMQVCRHRFILEQFDDPALMSKAWSGRRGWQHLAMPN